jgi:hypothetical protein
MAVGLQVKNFILKLFLQWPVVTNPQGQLAQWAVLESGAKN